MKKILSMLIAYAMVFPMAISSFAIVSGVSGSTSSTALYATLNSLSGAPIDGNGEQLKNADGVIPDQTVYFMLPDNMRGYLTDKNAFRVRFRKDRNAKLIQSISLVEKKLTSKEKKYVIPSGKKNPDQVDANQRHAYLAVTLNPTTSSSEFKVEFTTTFTARKDLPGVNFQYGKDKNNPIFAKDIKDGDRIELKGSMWVQNQKQNGDATVTVGSKGITVHPAKNDDNEVIFEGRYTMATLNFRTSSNPDSFFANLSTKWTSTEHSYFKNTDAVIRKFSPAHIDSISRATLMLNNPFDTDWIDPDDVCIYSIDSRGKPRDVTSSFTYDPNEDAFVTKTRNLGTWVISDRKIKLK